MPWAIQLSTWINRVSPPYQILPLKWLLAFIALPSLYLNDIFFTLKIFKLCLRWENLCNKIHRETFLDQFAILPPWFLRSRGQTLNKKRDLRGRKHNGQSSCVITFIIILLNWTNISWSNDVDYAFHNEYFVQFLNVFQIERYEIIILICKPSFWKEKPRDWYLVQIGLYCLLDYFVLLNTWLLFLLCNYIFSLVNQHFSESSERKFS